MRLIRRILQRHNLLVQFLLAAAPMALSAAPANDNFGNRIALSGAAVATTGSNVDATRQTNEPFHWQDQGGKSVWWTWTAVNSGSTRVTTFGSSFDTVLAVYTGGSLAGLSLVANNDDGGGSAGQSSVQFNATAGTVYQIAVDGFGAGAGAASGSVRLGVTNTQTVPITLVQTGAVWSYLDNGSDQSTAWRALDFPDNAWNSGPAELGYGDTDEATVVASGPAGNVFITTYFRHRFVATNIATIADLHVRAVRDDGIVVYLNGSEVFRDNMPEAAFTFTTPALSAVGGADESRYFTNIVNPALLLEGTNVLAVEIHQSGPGSSDVSFNLGLHGNHAGSNAPPLIAITSPSNNATVQGPQIPLLANASDPDGSVSKVEFFAGANKLGEDAGEPYSVLWTNAFAGSYQLRAVATDNLGKTATSAVVNLIVTGNAAPAVNITSPAHNAVFRAPTNLVVQASPSDSDGTVSKVEFFAGSAKLGEDLSSPYSFNWTNTVLGNFVLTALATDSGGAVGVSPPISITFTGIGPATLIATGAVWKYLDTGTDLGSAWTALGFDDSAWLQGPAELGYGDGDEATQVSFGPEPNNKYVTTYFRRAFTVANPAGFTFLTVRLKRDDGGIVYINGAEVFRSNMPQGPVSFGTFAMNAQDDGRTIFSNNVPKDVLQTGPNVVAVEIHQSDLGSSDISFDLELIGQTDPLNNALPQVSLTSPGNNSSFTDPADITVTTAAADSDGTITRVEVYQGTTLINLDTTGPYTFVWNAVPLGTYALRAVGQDNFGARSTSSVVNVFVVPSTAPTLASVNPPPGTVSNLTQVTVTFSEPVDGVNASDLLINGRPATGLSGSNAVHTFSFPEPAEGVIALTWADEHGIVDRELPSPKPFDSAGPGATWQYSLVDTVRPVVVKTRPAPGATIKALTRMEITFSEPVGGVGTNDLLINGQAATDVNGSGAGPYEFSFPQPANGNVQVAWAAGHGIRDFSAAQNLFAGGSWNYTLNTNLNPAAVVINEIMYHPSSHLGDEEYLELFNTGAAAVNLTGWRFSDGVDFSFPSVTLAPGAYLVVAANTAAFSAKYPAVANVIGNWSGGLSNSREPIDLNDAEGNRVDTVSYADEGDWALRMRGPDMNGHRGWEWLAGADGLGASLELLNTALSNEHGQNWVSSRTTNGTPGRVNSVATNNVAPLIIGVAHSPLVPQPSDPVTITARIIDEAPAPTVTLFFRDHTTASPGAFGSVPMTDNGSSGDGSSGDGIYGAILPARASGTVIEFYVQAADSGGRTRTWPAPARQEDGSSFAQTANALYQVDDSTYSGGQPLHRLILTGTEREELLSGTIRQTDAQMNATFITIDGTETLLRYNTSVRIRGAGSRSAPVPNYRVNVPTDRLWNGVNELNHNARYGYLQVLGSALALKSGVPSAHARSIQLRVNGENLADSGDSQFGSYVLLEVINGDWAENLFPADGEGNVYRASSGSHTARLSYIDPPTIQNYMNAGYQKSSNQSENDWSDLLTLTDVLSNEPDATYLARIRQVAHVQEWMGYFALFSMFVSMETSLATGRGDDYAMYRGLEDSRFQILPHDLDSILGQGESGGGSPGINLFRMVPAINPGANTVVLNRFMLHPDLTPLYYQQLIRMCDTTFSPIELNPLIDRLLGDYVATLRLDELKQFAADRVAYVRSQIPTNLSVNVSLPVVNGFFQTTSPIVALDGRANALLTRTVRVNGQVAAYNAWQQGSWSISTTLQPGLNRVVIQTFDLNGREFESLAVDIWYDDGTTTNVSGTLAGATTWSAAAGPFLVTGNVTVPAGATLTIEPSASVYFAQGTSLTINGRLLAEGTPQRRIRFTRPPGTANTWGGIRFNNSAAENRIVCADIEFASTADPITANNSVILVDQVMFSGTTRTIIDLANSSAIIRGSVFPTIVDNETIHGTGMPGSGYVIIESNYFGGTTGYSDIIDFTGGQRPGPILLVLNNVFNGGTDDAVDLDGTDAHLEGNLILNIHQDAPRDSASHAISTGRDSGNSSELTIVRNIIYGSDHGVLLKEGSSGIIENNTIVRIRTNAPAEYLAAVINFSEPDRNVAGGAGAALDGNILWDVDANRIYLHFTNAVMSSTVNHSIVPGTNWPGTGNLNADPLFLHYDPAVLTYQNIRQALSLRPGSPAIGTGPNGLDMGALVPAGASVSGEPISPTPRTTATLMVAGPGITHYRYRLNNGAYGVETAVTTPINLSGLTNGSYAVSVIGKNSAGVWQDTANATVSRSWLVNTTLPGIVINEALARNVAAVPVGANFPDLIELYNHGTNTVNLGGMGLSDEEDNPFKYLVPANTMLAPGQYLILYADNEAAPPGLHLGFALQQTGDEVFLFAANGRLIDSVRFGLQLPDLSIGRLASGEWSLTQPTLGAANVKARTGDPRFLRINEWLASGEFPFSDDFVELHNPANLPLGLGGLFLTDKIVGERNRHPIAPLSFIAAGGFSVFRADGNTEAGPDHLNFGLSSEQGEIGLYAADLSLIDCVIYGTQYRETSEGRSPNGSVNIVYFPSPTPGSPNPAPFVPNQTLLINEVLANNVTYTEPDGSTPDWLELYNPSTNLVDLSDMSLTDNSAAPRRYVFPPNSRIGPLGYRIIRFDGERPASTNNTGFGLAFTGSGVYLYDKLANQGGLLSSVVFGLQAADFSIGRIPNGSGPPTGPSAWALNTPTLAAANIAVSSLASPSNLKINEWLANPPSGDDDWFEVFNPNPQPVALGGLYLSDSLSNRTKHQIAPLSFIGVNVNGYQVFIADSDTAAGADHVSFALSAGGEALAISTAAGVLINGLSFGPQAEGVSQGRLPDGTGALVSFPQSPTPGESNFLPIPNVVVNEVLSHTDPPLEDAIELRNTGGAAVNIGGWYLSDSRANFKKYQIPAGTMLVGNGFRVFYEYQFNPLPGDPASFSFNSAKDDEAYLSAATNGTLSGYRAAVKFGPSENSVSFGRYQTSVGADFTALSQRTFGMDTPDTVAEFRQGTGLPNAYPKMGPVIISEIMYHPPDLPGGAENVADEFIELRNLTSSPLPLSHPSYPSNTWRLRDAVQFNFATNTVLPPNGYLLVVSFDPVGNPAALTAFRDRYGLSANVAIVGPYNGQLGNRGESVELYKPDTPQLPPDPDAGLVPYILVDKVRYSDTAPWPAGADGTGGSLQRVNLDEYGNDPINWMAGVPTPGPGQGVEDTDGDGMPNSWEELYNLNPNSSADAGQDPDMDGLTNLQEYEAGTHPRNAQSTLRLLIVSTGPVVLRFNAADDKSYTVEYKNILLAPSWTKLADVPQGVARIVQVTDPTPAGTRFYRVRTPQVP